MAKQNLHAAIQSVQKIAGAAHLADMDDERLLSLFIEQQNESAFAAVVQRHGPMVLGICRRVLQDDHAAEDAFQATFFVLAQKASSLSQKNLLGNWLYGVALRTAKKARGSTARWHATTVDDAPSLEEIDPIERLVWAEMKTVLDEEVQRLPRRFREPFVMCTMGGKSLRDAARETGSPLGTLSDRVSRAKEILRARLQRRGFGLSASLLGALFVHQTLLAEVPLNLARKTATGSLAPVPSMTPAGKLAHDVMRSIVTGKAGRASAIALTLVLVAGLGIGLMLIQSEKPPEKPPQVRAPVQQFRNDPTKKEASFRIYVKHLARSVAISPDGKTFAVGVLYDPGEEGAPEGGALVIGNNVVHGSTGAVLLYDARSQKLLKTIRVNAPIRAMDFSPDSKRLILCTGYRGGVIPVGRKGSVFPIILDVASGKAVDLTLDGHDSVIPEVKFLPDGKRAITVSGDGTGRIWDLKTGKELLKLAVKNWCRSVAISPDGKQVVIGAGDVEPSVWSTTTGKKLASLPKGNFKHLSSAWMVAWSPDGSHIAACSNDTGIVRLWDAKTCKPIGALFEKEYRDPQGKIIHRSLLGKVTSNLIFSPDGRWLLTGQAGEGDLPARLVIWDVKEQKVHKWIPEPKWMIKHMTFTKDGRSLLYALENGIVILKPFAELLKGSS